MTETQNTFTACPTKLRNGSWGATVAQQVGEGDVITVRTRAGKEWQAQVVKIVWSDGSKYIVSTCSVKTPAPETSAPRITSGGECYECGKRTNELRAATDSSGIRGECCRRCWSPRPSDLSFC